MPSAAFMVLPPKPFPKQCHSSSVRALPQQQNHRERSSSPPSKGSCSSQQGNLAAVMEPCERRRLFLWQSLQLSAQKSKPGKQQVFPFLQGFQFSVLNGQCGIFPYVWSADNELLPACVTIPQLAVTLLFCCSCSQLVGFVTRQHVCRNEGSSEALSLVCPTDASRRDDYGAVVHSFSTLQLFACEGSLLVIYTCQYVGVCLIRPVQGCLFAGS